MVGATCRGRRLRRVNPAPYFTITHLAREIPNACRLFRVLRGEIFGIAGLVGAGPTAAAEAIWSASSRAPGEFLLDACSKNLSPADATRRCYLIPKTSPHRIDCLSPIRENGRCRLPRYPPPDWVDVSASRGVIGGAATERQAPSVRGGKLSGGNRKGVLAKWLSLNPAFYFHEPTAALRGVARRRRFTTDSAARPERLRVIMISRHERFRRRDRIAVMHEGCVTGA